MNLVKSLSPKGFSHNHLADGGAYLGLLLLSIGAALNHYTFDIAGISLRPEHLALAVAGVGWLIGLRWSRYRLGLSPQDNLLVGYVVVAVSSSLLNAPDTRESLKFSGLMLIALVSYGLVKSLVVDVNIFINIIKANLVIALLVASYGIISWLLYPLNIDLGINLYRLTNAPAEEITTCSFSPYATLIEPNIFGSYLMSTGLISLAWLSWSKQAPGWLKLGLVLIPLGLAVSLTRGAWVGFGIGLVLIWLLAKNKARASIISLLVVGLLLIFILIAGTQKVACTLLLPTSPEQPVLTVRADSGSEVIRTRLPGLNPPPTTSQPDLNNRLLSDYSVSWRLEVIKRAIQDWLKNPLLGNGPNSFGQSYTNSSNMPDWIGNVAIMALHDTGLVGVALLLGWLVWFVRDLYQALRKSPRSELSMLVVALSLAAFSLLLAFQITTALWLGFSWILLGLLRAGTRLLAQQSNNSI